MFWDTQAAKVGGGMGCEPNCVSHLCLLPPSAWGVCGGGRLQWLQMGQWLGRACEDTGPSSLRAKRPPPPRNLRSLESCPALPIPPHPHRLCRHSRPLLAGSLVRSAPQAPASPALGAGRSLLSLTLRTPGLHCHLALLLAGHSAPPFSQSSGAHPPTMARVWAKEWCGSWPKPG